MVSEFRGLAVPSSDLDFALGWRWSKPVADPNACYWALGCQADETAHTGRSWLTPNQEDFLLHAAGFVPNPEPCGSYSLTRFCLHYDCALGRVLTSEFTTTATVAPETPPRSVFATSHSAAAGAESDVASALILPTATDLAALFAAEWAAAEWRAADGGEVLARRRETDTSGWWSDANQSAIRQTVRETLAAATLPALGAADVYVRVLEKTGTPDRFADRAAGRYWFERTLGGGGPVELAFSPAGLPDVPDPVFPGGTYEAVTRQRFSLHTVIRYDGVPGFEPLPAPPDAAPAAPDPAAGGLDTDRDDLVEVGADLASWGPDTGTIALRPEWLHPQVLLPLGVALWDCLPVHAYLCQGGFDDRPETALKHPDAGPLWFAYSLHTRAYVERLVRTAGARRKVAEVVRPRGNRIAFEFPWDAAAGAFSPLGFPLGPNRRRTSILRDLTPADDLDACFELCFDSGIVHGFCGGSRAEGTLRQVRHDDGRAVRLDALTDCAFGLDGGRFTSPRCSGTLTWAAGRLVRLDYTWRCGSGTLGVDLLYGPTPRGAWVTRLAKSIPGLDVAHTGSFGFQGAAQTVTHGSGVVVTRSGGSIVTTRPDGGSVQEVTTLNADGLPVRLETFANGGSHAVGFHYSGGAGRHPANGAAAWAHLTRIDHPDGAWQRFAYDPQTGWPTEVVTPFGNAPPEAAESLCRVTRFAYDRTLSAGLAPDPARLTERPRRVVTETLGVETARTYHAYETEGPAGRSVRRRRCVAAGAAWDAAGNLQTVARFNRYGPPDLETPTGSTRWTAAPPAADRIVLTESCSSGRRTVRTLNALGTVLTRQTSESGSGVTLVTDETYSGIDPFGRIARTDYLDGTWEAFLERQWHGGPLRRRCRDGSEAVCTYTPDGALASVARYGVTTSVRYDDLGRVSDERRTAGNLSVQTRARFDSRGRQTLAEDELGRRTLTAYSGTRCRTLRPDGSWAEEEHFLDGTPARLSGDAAAETLCEYGVDPAAGAWSCVRRRSPSGFVDRSLAWRDLLGRIRQTARTVDGGPPETMSATFFDAQGRPCRRVDADGVTTLTTYNDRNEVVAVALDLDRDGAIGSADRVAAYRRRTAWSAPPGGADPVACLVSTVGGPAPDAVAETAVAVDGRLHCSTVNGRTTATRTTLGAGPGERTVTTTFPDGTAEVQTYAEGLLRRRIRLDAGGEETASETLEYDALRRLVRRRDDTTGVVSEVALDAAGRVTAATRSDAPGSERYDYDAMGRLTRLRQRGGGDLEYQYEPSGLLHRESGSDTLPRRWQYDPRGLCTGLWTWRGGLDGDGAVLTEWVYDAHSGRLSDRKLGGLTVEEYRYSKAGRLERLIHRTAAGDVVTDLARDAAGEVAAVTHSDGSAGAVAVCDPAGRPLQVTDAVGTRRLTCDADGRVCSETLPQLPGGMLESAYDPAGRRTGLRLVVDGTAVLAWTRAFDAAGRLASASDGRCRVRYEYRPGSDLVARTVCGAADGPDRLLIERTWDSQARLTRLAATLPAAGSAFVASWQYVLDADGRRTQCDASLADPADPAAVRTVRWDYAYDALGQLAAAVCRNPVGGAALPGRRFAYAHDTVANRLSAGRAEPATGTGEETYTVNDLNQYTVRTVPGAVHVSGFADPDVAVTANGEPAERDGAAFHVRVPVDNAAGPAVLELVLRAVRTDPAGGSWVVASETRFVYDGWNLLAEFAVADAGAPVLTRSHLWGLDLDGLRTGRPDGPQAGGVGGLVAVTEWSGTPPAPGAAVYAVADGGGSISALVAAAPAADPDGPLETVEYEPFGRVLARHRAGPGALPARAAPLCPFGFSSKYLDPDPGLLYFGLRYYSPDLGRWLCRDPLGEPGGLNLYAYCHNDPVNRVDPLGDRAYGYDYTGALGPLDWREAAYTQAEVDQVYACLAARDRHIYNPGLANTGDSREASRRLVEETLGVPVAVAWNPTFARLGSDLRDAGERIGGYGWTWNPLKLGANGIGGIAEAAGFALTAGGVALDVLVAGAEKIPVLRDADPTYWHSMSLYRDALRHVMAESDPEARVYGWMHSEGAIHGASILGALSDAEARRVTARTFGAGGYLFPARAQVRHYACISAEGWEDPVPAFAGMNIVRNKADIVWVQAAKPGWPHGMETYTECVILGIAKDYFTQNARTIWANEKVHHAALSGLVRLGVLHWLQPRGVSVPD